MKSSYILAVIVYIGLDSAYSVERVVITPDTSGQEPYVAIKTSGNSAEVYYTPETKLHSKPLGSSEWSVKSEQNPYSFIVDGDGELFRAISDRQLPERPAELFVPDSYENSKSYPLILSFHAFQSSPEQAEAAIPLKHLLDQEEFLLCTPAGTYFPDFNSRAWNVVGIEALEGSIFPWVDDVAYVTALVAEIKKQYLVDENRIYCIGHSLGGGLVHTLLERRSDIFAAGISHAGTNYTGGFHGDVSPDYPVSILEIRGTDDSIVLYEGGATPSGARYPSASESLQYWAEAMGCSPKWRSMRQSIDIDSQISGKETGIFKFDCENVTIEHWKRVGSSHQHPVTEEFSVLVLDWLMAHPKNR